MTIAGGEVKRRVLPGVAAHQVWVCSYDHLHDSQPSVQGRQVQRGLEFAVPNRGVRELLQENRNDFRVSVLSGTVQGGFVLIVLFRAKVESMSSEMELASETMI